MVPLSRDHHFGLLCCWKIRQGIRNEISPERIAAYVVYFRNLYLDKHFAEEETFLFNQLEHDQQCLQAIEEHRQLEIVMNGFTDGATTVQLSDFADQLDAHIRFEERVLFPHLEKVLPEDTLTSLGETLEELHGATLQEDYQDIFWEIKPTAR